jgi:HD-GYP domain-containing protein (c-di-GMP phosphodiesterase class II)
MSTAETLITPHRAAWPRLAAVLATLAAGGGMAVGHPEPALAAAVVGLGAIALGLRSRQAVAAHVGLDLVRSITGRAASAERLDGTITTTLEGLTVGAGAIGAAAIVRRGDSALCDAYSWADGRFVHEELLWRDEIAGAVDSTSERGASFLPTRLGRPRRWVARPIVSHGESCGVLVVAEPASETASWLAQTVAVLGAHVGALVVGERLHERLERGYVATIEALIGTLEAKDPYTAGHSNRVAAYSLAIGAELGLPESMLPDLHTGAILHDIGKVGVVDSVLFKPTRLSEDEFDQIKDHPRRGARIIDSFNRSATVLGIVFHHHERYDGRGYPAGLRGVDIPLAARIVNVADAFDAMTTNRPYGKTKTHAEATIELQRGAGSQFDPQVVAALIRARGNGRI